jgi:polyhydroxyalkanoate synthesis regulator phasin
VGILTNVLLLPLAPVRGLEWVVDVLMDEAEREMAAKTDPARRLEDLAAMTANGEISPEEAARLEDELITQILSGEAAAGAGR